MHLLFVWEEARIVEPELGTCSVNLDVFSLGFKLRSLLNYAPSQQPWDIFPLGFSVNTNVCMNLNVHARVLFSSKSHCHFCKGLKQAIFHIDLLFSLYFVSLGIRVRLLRRFNITLPNWNTALCKNHVPQLISFNFAMQQFNKTCLCIHKKYGIYEEKQNWYNSNKLESQCLIWPLLFFTWTLSSRVVSLRRVWE